MEKHKYIRGDRVEAPEQMFVGQVITHAGIGVVQRVEYVNDGNAKRDQQLLIIKVDGQTGERKYFADKVRWMGGPE